MSTNEMTRRTFLGATASAAAFTIVPSHVLGGPRHKAPSEKLNIAGIGAGGIWAILRAVADRGRLHPRLLP